MVLGAALTAGDGPDGTTPSATPAPAPAPAAPNGTGDAVELPDRGPATPGPTDDDAITCDTTTGPVDCVLWDIDLDLPGTAEVDLAGGRIVVADPVGHLAAYAAGDAEPVWEHRLGSPLTRHPGTVSGMLAYTADDRTGFVSIAHGERTEPVPGPVLRAATVGTWLLVDDGDRLSARGVSGEPAWQRPLGPDERTWLNRDGALLASDDGHLTALFENTGRDRWQVDLPAPVVAAERVGPQAVAIAGDPPQLAVVTGDGELSTRRLPGAAVEMLPLRETDAVAVLSADDNDRLYIEVVALHGPYIPATLTLDAIPSRTLPVVGDADHLVFADRGGRLYVLDLAEVHLQGPLPADRPVIDVALTSDGDVLTLDRSGVSLRSVDDDSEVVRVDLGPGVADVREIVATEPTIVRVGGRLLALDLATAAAGDA